jgi:polyhydroxyalkanoate synthesis regulator phasin
MADDKNHHDHELAKSSAIEVEATASKLLSLVDANVANGELTPEENKRILRKLDMWSVSPIS